MPRALDTIDLGDDGAVYVRTRLSELRQYGPSLSIFCDALVHLMRANAGTIVANVPSGASAEQVREFESSGLLPANRDPSRVIRLADGSTMVPVESLFDEEFDRVSALLCRAPGLVAIAVDPQPRRGDPCLQGYAETIFYAGDEAYHLLSSATPEDAARRALSAAPHWVNLVVLTSVAPKLDANRCTDAADLAACATAAIEASCGAYDGEGFLNWRRG